jgi:tripartite-type tricarboxylate transporter receptor subunit TctC
MAQLKTIAGVNIAHIPYKGDAPTTNDMLGGTVHTAFMTPVPGIAHVKEGRLKLLAVLVPQRSALAPDVPTIAEAGMPGVSITPWAGLFAPAKLPKPIVERLSRDMQAILARAEIRDTVGRQGFETQGSTPSEMDRYNREQLQTWKRVIAEAKIPLE